jgi:hypothetical protein
VRVAERREITLDEVLRAGRILFGPAFAAEARGWRDALRATYRRRALETHPDRARALGRAEVDLLREFRAVAEAYRILSSVRAGTLPRRAAAGAPPGPARPASSPAAPPGPAPAARGPRAPRPGAPTGARLRASIRSEELPRRRLRFAEYLYYSGRVRWSDLADALAWQRAQRPPVGRIAVRFGFLSTDDVGVILERRREAGARTIPFGEWAVRLGYLTTFQLLATIGQQLRFQRPIGQFFVERGMIDPGEIDAVCSSVLRHNLGFAA